MVREEIIEYICFDLKVIIYLFIFIEPGNNYFELI